jgi:hypothetical protein
MNNATDPTLTDFDMSHVRRFFISDGKVCFDEDAHDLVASEREKTAVEIATKRATRPLRNQPMNRDGWDMLRAREDYLKLRATKVE